MNLKSLTCITGFFLILLFSACGSKEEAVKSPDPDLILLTYGDRTIDARDVSIAFQESHSFEDLLIASFTQTATDIVRDIAEDLAFKRIIGERARALGLQEKESFKQIHERVVKDELYQKLMIDEVLSKIRFTERDLKRFL